MISGEQHNATFHKWMIILMHSLGQVKGISGI